MSDFFQFLVLGENLVFLSCLMIFAALLTLQMMGFVGDAIEGGVDLDFDADVDVDFDADGGIADAAHFPVITLLMLFCGSFGILGLATNKFLHEYAQDMQTFPRLAAAIAGSSVVSLFFSRATARRVGAWLPDVETHGIDGTDLNGCVATVISEKMAVDTLGRISVTDHKAGNYTLRGKLMQGHEEVANGGLVVVVQHDQNSDICFCVPESAWTMPRK